MYHQLNKTKESFSLANLKLTEFNQGLSNKENKMFDYMIKNTNLPESKIQKSVSTLWTGNYY